MSDVYEVRKNLNEDKKIEVQYSKPKFWHRCMANFVDFFIFLVMFLCLFLTTRSIVQSTGPYKETQARIYDMQIASGIYVASPSENPGTPTIDFIYYLDTYYASVPAGSEFDTDINDDPQFLNGKCIKQIKIFIRFCSTEATEERYKEILVYYDEARLTPTLNDVHYFLKDDSGNIVPNPTLTSDPTKLKSYYTNIYKPFIEKKCIPFLSVNVPEYSRLLKIDYNLLLFLELPLGYILGGIFTYFIPPLFFKRGRMTLGKALYHIGLIDTRLLSPKFSAFLGRFAIFFFGELILSLASFGIPYIISFSMMAFSKRGQGFPDYMMKLLEVDTSKANIYMDYVEAMTKNQLHGKAIDFRPEQPL